MAKRHVIISGTGRAGTTLLVQLLTALGMDTGFDSPSSDIYANCNAGMELDLRQPRAPYIVKSPWLCDYLEEVVASGQVAIDHAIIPMRDLYAAAESRREVARQAGPDACPDGVPGGLWHTTSPDEQEAVLARQLFKLLRTLAEFEIPVTLLSFPRFVTDPQYLYRNLAFLLKGVGYDAFHDAVKKVSKPELVHDFRQRNPATGSVPSV